MIKCFVFVSERKRLGYLSICKKQKTKYSNALPVHQKLVVRILMD